MDEALRLGHAVQYNLLPRELPPGSPVEAAAVLESYCHLSGDMFGWDGSRDDEFTVWLLDVSGHGVRAGFAAVVMNLLLAEIDLGLPLAELPSRLEDRFQAVRNPDDSLFLYATGVFVRIAGEGHTGYVSAGHQPLFLCRNDGPVQTFESTGMPIALITGNPWQLGEMRLSGGDTLLVYSDGLVEQRNDAGEFFGERCVIDVLRRGGPPAAIADNLVQAAEDHHDLDRLDDDLGFIVLRYRGEP
jgi:sigma-B regulation protein RsbU (phosphoserine phosphatase)